MKELSIEEKAQAYDEALERAKKVHKYSSDLAEIKRMEHVFPELRESKDEKMRKEIVGYLKKNLRYEWATWLEKQGQNPTWSEEDEEMYQNIHECLKNGWRKLPTDLLKYDLDQIP